MDLVKLVDLSLERQIDAVSQAFEKMPSGTVLRLSCLEEYVAGFSLERAFIAWTAERADEIVKAALLDVCLETATVEANEGFLYVRVSDGNGDLIYRQCPLASVLALLKGIWPKPNTSGPFNGSNPMSQNVLSRQTMQYLPVKLYWLGELKASKGRTLSALAILRNSDSKETHSLANRDREGPLAHRGDNQFLASGLAHQYGWQSIVFGLPQANITSHFSRMNCLRQEWIARCLRRFGGRYLDRPCPNFVSNSAEESGFEPKPPPQRVSRHQ
jgi:hypothetical protein